MAPREPNMLLLFVLCFAGAAALIGMLRLNHWWQTRERAPQTVKTSQEVMSRPQQPTLTDKTDRPADRLSVSAQIEKPPRLQLDKTREALIEELLTLGWTMKDFRREQIFRGDNNKISAEVEAARKRLGIESGDHRTPIAGRPTSAEFAAALEYQPPPR